MAEVKKARLFLRRGLDTDRLLTVLCEGELGYSTDAFRVVVGDGTTLGGKNIDSKVFVKTTASYDTTLLSAASAAGYAMHGDLAVFPSDVYNNAAGVANTIDSTHALTVKMLTGSDNSAAASWVNINDNIPFGNISVSADDITGDYLSGGTISGPISVIGSSTTLSGGDVIIGGNGSAETLYLSAVALSAEGGAVPSNNIYPLGITNSGAVTALTGVESFTNRATEHRTYYMYSYPPENPNDSYNDNATNNVLQGETVGVVSPANTAMGTFLAAEWPDAVEGDTVQLLWGGAGYEKKISFKVTLLFGGWLVANLTKSAGAANVWNVDEWVLYRTSGNDNQPTVGSVNTGTTA